MKRLAITLLALTYFAAVASPVEFDTDTVHVVVIRPLDSWSGDASNSQARLDAVRDKKVYYQLTVDNISTGKKEIVSGGAQAFGSVSQHPIAQAGREALLKYGFTASQDTKIGFGIEYPVSLQPDEWSSFLRVQLDSFKESVISQGNPSTLQNRTKTRKFFGGLFAAATMVGGMNRLGTATGLNATLGSGVANDAYRITVQAGQALAPVRLPQIDLAIYTKIDVRRITNFIVPTGQLIFAYKGEKTPEAELDALIKSIVVIAGADTTPEAVEKARTQDYEARLAIWNACVAEGDSRCNGQ